MSRLPAVLAAATLAAAFPSTPSSAGQAPAAGVEDARAAVEMLREAAAALGGEARLATADSLSVDYRGRLHWVHQGPRPGEPAILAYGQESHFDWAGRRLLLRLDFQGPESQFRRRLALEEGPDRPSLVEAAALFPHAVVRHWLDRPADLLLVEERGDGATLAGPLHGRLVRLDLDGERRPRRLRILYADPVAGDAERVVEYDEYREGPEGWRVPGRVRQSEAGDLVLDLDLELAGFAPGAPAPDWTEGLEPAAAAGAAESPGLEAVPLAEGIHLLRGHGGGDYHGLLVELAEGLMVLETPEAIGDGEELRRVAAALSPKPILYAVPTHHHGDHSAGAAALARGGATILTTPGNVDFFTRMAASPRALGGAGGDGRGGRAPDVRALAPGEAIGPVRFLDVGSSHAEEHLVFWFPAERILFHSDMGRFNPDGSVEPARAQGCALLAFIERRGLDVERIVGGHGRTGTIDDLRRAAELRDPPCPAAAAGP